MALNLSLPEHEELKPPRITVFGVGGAGGNAVNNMIDKQLEGVEFVVANTDAQALQQSNAPAKIQMGVKVTEGAGRGRPCQRGRGGPPRRASSRFRRSPRRRAHVLHHRGYGRRTGTGAAPITRPGRARAWRADRGRCDEALPVRGRQADEAGRCRYRGPAEGRRHAHHHSEPEPVSAGQRAHDLSPRPSRSPTTCSTRASRASPT